MKTRIALVTTISLIISPAMATPFTGAWLKTMCQTPDDRDKMLAVQLFASGVLDRTVVEEKMRYCVPEGQSVANAVALLCEFIDGASEGTLAAPLAMIVPPVLSDAWTCHSEFTPGSLWEN